MKFLVHSWHNERRDVVDVTSSRLVNKSIVQLILYENSPPPPPEELTSSRKTKIRTTLSMLRNR